MSVAPDRNLHQSLVVELDRPSPSTAVCRVRGEIDLSTERVFRAGLERAIGAAHTIVVDLCEVTFIGSIAAPIVIDAFRRLTERQTLKVVTGQSSAKVFAILGLNDIVDCFPGRSSI